MGPDKYNCTSGELYIQTKAGQSRIPQKEFLIIQELANNIPQIGNL